MAWSEAERILKSDSEINEYLNEMGGFHDYVIGSLSCKSNEIRIGVEEECNLTKPKENKGMIWFFTIHTASEVIISLDCIMRCFVSEISLEGNQYHFDLDNGYIGFKSDNAELRIPQRA